MISSPEAAHARRVETRNVELLNVPPGGALPESAFAAIVDALAADRTRRGQLAALLPEDHPVYDQRGTAAIVRMRGWLLLALARVGLCDDELLFVLEELDAGHDGYLVAAAARALRSYPSPRAPFAPFVMRALGNMRYADEWLALDAYGAYATSSTGTTPIRELLATLIWLGPHAREVLPQLEALRTPGCGIPKKVLPEVERAVKALRSTAPIELAAGDCCALPGPLGSFVRWPVGTRAGSEAVQSTVFEDQDGARISYADFFRGQPSIVAFFYTRCDNPQKCSLTVSKLARVQQILAERGLADRVRSAGITYDPGFDLPSRLRPYGLSRGLRMDDRHRLLRAADGLEPLRAYFKLGVNFIESLVNRHRIEVYVLDAAGRIAASFRRIHWDEREVVDRAAALLDEPSLTAVRAVSAADAVHDETARVASPAFATLTALAIALFPKCPFCWTAYMSVFGIASLERIPYSPGILPLLFAVLSLNIAAAWWRMRSTGRMGGVCLTGAGGAAIVLSKIWPAFAPIGLWGVVLTFAGSMLSVRGVRASASADSAVG